MPKPIVEPELGAYLVKQAASPPLWPPLYKG